MNGSRRIRFGFSFFLIIIILISEKISPVYGDGEESDNVAKKEENPSLAKIISGIFGKKFPPSSWELIQGAMQKIQMKLYPPNLDFRTNSEEEDKGEKVKEAATRSLEVSKETIEESAKLAGDVVGDVVHKTAKKVAKQNSHDEM